MSVSKAEASAELSAIDDMVRRVKRSQIYRITGQITLLWGVLDFARYLLLQVAPPATQGWSWLLVDGFGVALTLALILRGPRRVGLQAGRAFAAYAIFYAFGMMWSFGLARFGGREMDVFWHTLFLFGYSLAGLWFGAGFLVLGLGVAAAIFAVYLFAGVWFWPLIALVSGAGYIACGLWMLRE